MPLKSLAHQLEAAIMRLGYVPSVGSDSAPPLQVIAADPRAAHRADPALTALRTSAAPVLYAPHYEPREDGPLRIFAPIDFLRGTEPVLAWIRDLAAVIPAEIVLGTVVKSVRSPGELEAAVDDATRALAVYARNAGFGQELVGVRVIEGERVAEQILDQASVDRCDVIVMGSHGKDGIARFFVGSTTESLLRLADRPVLVLRKAPR